ncbi:hypothetical protein [Nonomuraea recticatena]|uniref:hypothetical protein n=1 Tax=Nonomuraea recticatena TaxID=46178 RepID=UPI003623903C
MSLALVAASVALALVAVSTGEFTVPVADIVTALFGQGTPVAELIVSQLRALAWSPGSPWAPPSG